MTFDKQTARIILQKIFTFASTIKLNMLGNLIIGLDSSTLNDVPNSEVKLNLNLILNYLDYADPFFKEILIRKVKRKIKLEIFINKLIKYFLSILLVQSQKLM